MTESLENKLNIVLANSYVLYLKTQNYHWNVRGANFMSLHLLFQDQYSNLALAIDEIAERIVTLGFHAHGSFKSYLTMATIKEVNDVEELHSESMLKDLIFSQELLILSLKELLLEALKATDDATIDLATQRIKIHEKNMWMLKSSLPIS